MVLYDKAGRIIRLGRAVMAENGAAFDALGAPRFGARRLHYADRLTTADPGSRLASAITDGGEGVGISFPLTGLWGSADWGGAYPYIVWSLEDVFGAPLGGTVGSATVLSFVVRPTVPTPLEEVWVGMAIVNETDLASATVDGAGCAITWTGAVNPAAQTLRLNNGTSTSVTGSTSAGMVSCVQPIAQVGTGTARMVGGLASGQDSAGAVLNAATATGVGVFSSNPSRLYVVLAAGRTSAGAAGNFTALVDAYVAPCVRSQLVF